MEDVKIEPKLTINLQYRRAEGEPMINCGDVEMKLKDVN